MRVISQHNLWFRGKPSYANYKLFGRSMISVPPLLGRRPSSDAGALRQEMQWLHRYTGRDGRNFVYALEWIRPGDIIDLNLNEVFLPAIEKTRAHWNLFYDPVLAMRQREVANELPIDFSHPAVAKIFRSDLAYFWDNYLEHPNYWHLRGKPVLYIWSVSTALENTQPLLDEARAQGIYLLGDTFGGRFEVPRLDGYTGFVAATPELQGKFTDIESVLPVFRNYYRRFRDADELSDGDLIPALSAQYDDTNFQSILGGRQTRILARDRSDVELFLRLAKNHAHGIDGQRHVFFGTTNNWAEGSSILPTRLSGRPYQDDSSGLLRIGRYGFEHLEALRDTLFPHEPVYQGPRIEQRESGTVQFYDCDLLGDLKVKGRVENHPDWRTGENVLESDRGDRVWRPQGARGVQLRFRNLDGRRTKVRVS